MNDENMRDGIIHYTSDVGPINEQKADYCDIQMKKSNRGFLLIVRQWFSLA